MYDLLEYVKFDHALGVNFVWSACSAGSAWIKESKVLSSPVEPVAILYSPLSPDQAIIG